MRGLFLVGMCMVLGCGATRNGSSGSYSAALALAGIGVIGSGVSRASGGCYAVCTRMDVCNPMNGLCEPNPCGPGCGVGRHCDTHAPAPRCVDDGTGDLVSRPPPNNPFLTPLPGQ